MLGRVTLILGGLVAVFALVAAPAFARANQGTDPGANTPAGVIYSIPLDSARQDAAPHNGSAVGGHGGGSGGSTSGGSGSGAGAGSVVVGSGPVSGGGVPSDRGGSRGIGSSGTGAQRGSGSDGSSSSGRASNAVGSGVVVGGAGVNGAPILVPGGQPGSLIHSANGFGASSAIPGLGRPASAGLGAVQGSSSMPLVAYLLAGIVLLVGGFVGVRAWR